MKEAKIIQTLEYIANSPPRVNGGFHENTIAVARGSLRLIGKLRNKISEVKKSAYIDIKKVEHLINVGTGVKYLEKSKDKIDRVHAKVMRNNHNTVARMIGDICKIKFKGGVS